MGLVYLPTCTIQMNHSCRYIFQSHGSYGKQKKPPPIVIGSKILLFKGLGAPRKPPIWRHLGTVPASLDPKNGGILLMSPMVDRVSLTIKDHPKTNPRKNDWNNPLNHEKFQVPFPLELSWSPF